MNPNIIQFLIQLLGLGQQNLSKPPGQSQYGREASVTPTPNVADRYKPLLGGSEASLINTENADSYRNYQAVPSGPWGILPPPEDPLIQILQFLMKPQG